MKSEWVLTLGIYGCALSALASAMRSVRCDVANVGVMMFFTSSRPMSRLIQRIYKAGLRRAGVTFFMTKAQLDEAVSRDGCPAGRASLIRIGVDTEFFAPAVEHPGISADQDEFVSQLRDLNPYVAVAGDQLRDEEAVARVLFGLSVNLVRVTRNRYVESFWRERVRNGSVGHKVLCRAGIGNSLLRSVYCNATAVLNLADASWQPAGWSVTTEAMACGTPTVLQRGLVSEELERLFRTPAGEFLHLVEPGDETSARLHLRNILAKRIDKSALSEKALTLTRTHLTIEHTVEDIVSAMGLASKPSN